MACLGVERNPDNVAPSRGLCTGYHPSDPTASP
jgi:hypothetical protein